MPLHPRTAIVYAVPYGDLTWSCSTLRKRDDNVREALIRRSSVAMNWDFDHETSVTLPASRLLQ